MKRFWIYFTGTANGQHIVASTMKEAKQIFASINNVPVTGYISGRKGQSA